MVKKRSERHYPLSKAQYRAIELFLSENKAWKAIADELEIDGSTLYRWRTENTLFIDELNRQHEIHVREAASRAANNIDFAAAALRQIIAEKNPRTKKYNSSDKDRIEAAKLLCDVNSKNLEILSNIRIREEFDARIKALEEKDAADE